VKLGKNITSPSAAEFLRFSKVPPRGAYHASAFWRQKRDFMAVVKQNNKPRKLGAGSAREGVGGDLTSGRAAQLPTDLHLSGRSSLTDMAPGDIIFLDDFAYLRESFTPNFVAVLACPLCGSPGLITSAQYSGGAPIVCTSKTCSGLFRIIDEAQIVPLPPS
jgi:hypothetical protein